MKAYIKGLFLLLGFALYISARCVPAAEYTKLKAFALSPCRGTIERAGLYSIDDTSPTAYQKLFGFQFDPRVCRSEVEKWAVDRDAWRKGDCEDSVLDLCCMQEFPQCNVSLPPANQTYRTCYEQCLVVEFRCRLTFGISGADGRTSEGDDRCLNWEKYYPASEYHVRDTYDNSTVGRCTGRDLFIDVEEMDTTPAPTPAPTPDPTPESSLAPFPTPNYQFPTLPPPTPPTPEYPDFPDPKVPVPEDTLPPGPPAIPYDANSSTITQVSVLLMSGLLALLAFL